jgi:acyl-CoA reductase-like NAD-dependent aldehyde dehydrogenase
MDAAAAGQPPRFHLALGKYPEGGSVMSVVTAAVLRPATSSAVDEMRVTLERQRAAFLDAGAPSLTERCADLARVKAAIRDKAEPIAQAISADFGNRSRHESLLARGTVPRNLCEAKRQHSSTPWSPCLRGDPAF